ncbi:MAG TPA: ATP-binding protein [Opitutaceae bacterium]
MNLHSIRGRLLGWFAFLLGCILAGFGVLAYQFHSQSEQQRIDGELERRVALLQADLREGGGPGPGREGPPPPMMMREGEPPLFGKKKGPSPGEGRRGPGMGFEGGPGGARTLRVTAVTASLFEETDRASFYYAAWTSRGAIMGQSANAPAELPIPESSETGRRDKRTRGAWREVYQVTERGDYVLAGISMAASDAASARLGWMLAAAGGAVLLLGLGGGWWTISRSLRPVREIGATARRIAEGDLSERISTSDARSELGELATVLNSTFARLDAAFAEQKNFTADASHELRTPLAVILTETQRVLSRERTAAEYREAIEVCRETAQEMKRLTESLLELARFDAGQETLRRQPFDLAVVAQAAVDLMRPLAVERNLKVDVACAPVSASGDPARLRQVVVNLLQNAVRYNRDGGAIRVTTSASANENEAVLTVSDTGSGIAAEALPHVFERFYRADKARSRAQGGTGLGLAICKAIVEAHGGSIAVESEVGKGTTVAVRVPRG